MANFRNIGADFSAGLRAPHYTNGRLLTAEDLQRDQEAVLDRLAQLGKGAGYGVIEGFRVSAISANRSLRISAGSGINRRGDVVRLATESVTLPVQPVTDDDAGVRRSGRFEACTGDDATPDAALDDGAYLLTVAPLARLEGFAPRQSCDGAETATCANQWEVEGVEFKIIRLTEYKAPTGNRRDRNRNLLAHWFYGSAALSQLMRNPFEFDQAYTGFADIAAADLTECDLPLAAFFWADEQVGFVEEWAARRRLYHPYPGTDWKANISDQRVAEGEARFVQFQDQAADLQQRFRSNTRSIRATTHFAYLPPVGLLPVNPYELIVTDVFEQSLTKRQQALMERLGLSSAQVLERVRTGVLDASNQGDIFNLDRYFGDYLPDQLSIVHEDEIHMRLQQSWVQPAIQLPAPPSTPVDPFNGFFEFTLADNTAVAVTDNNFGAILGGFQPDLFGFATFERATPATTRSSTGPTISNAAARPFLAEARFAARQPDWFFVAPTADEEAVEPLVDILVIDEMLAPYHAQLIKEMEGRIDAAITGLTTGVGGVFVGENILANVNADFANAMLVNAFMATAANTGAAAMVDWLRLVDATKQPLFYVIFVRHQPRRIKRSLRLSSVAT